MMKVKVFIMLVVIECVSGKYIRIHRQTDEDSNPSQDENMEEENTPLEEIAEHPTSHCIENIAKSFTCSEGSFDEILTEVTSQANVLKIEKISLPSIPDSAMQTFTNLVELSIRESNVSSLNSKTFQGLDHLESLDLSNNSLNGLSTSYFNQLGELLTLNISSNKINPISNNAFKGLKILQDLDLSRNYIENIPSGIFTFSPGIITINLSHNRLSTIPNALFSSMQNLQTLNLANNRISEFQDKSFNSIPALQKLYIQGNKLRSFEARIFGGSALLLNHISLESNELQQIDAEQLLNKTPALKTLGIAPNPWDCNCLNYMLDVIDGKNIDYTPREYFEGLKPVCKISEAKSYSNDVNPCKSTSSTTATTSKPTTPQTTSRSTTLTAVTTPKITSSTRSTPKTSVTTSAPTSTTLRFAIPFWLFNRVIKLNDLFEFNQICPPQIPGGQKPEQSIILNSTDNVTFKQLIHGVLPLKQLFYKCGLENIRMKKSKHY